MYISAETLDDLLYEVLERLLSRKTKISPSRGSMTEIAGAFLRIRNPRARLSRTETKGHVFSCLGELLWYLAGTKELSFVRYYIEKYAKESEDGKTVYGGYGPRLYAMRGQNQIANVLTILKRNPSSRRAVIQLFDAGDIAKKRLEIPCTCTLQFMIRRNRLRMFTTMRSNDAFKGLPHDVFAFTMIQELVGRSLNVEIGQYNHFVSSLHLYDEDIRRARRYIGEGIQSRVSMPPMPVGNPDPSIRVLLQAEASLRRHGRIKSGIRQLEPYWSDLIRILEIYRYSKDGDSAKFRSTKRQMHSPVFNAYIQKRQQKTPASFALEQLEMPFPDGKRT